MISPKGLVWITILIILFVGIFGCGNEEKEISSDNYLPLKVGNWWKYTYPDNPSHQGKILITGTTQLKDGKTVLIGEAVVDNDKTMGYLSKAADDIITFHKALDELRGELLFKPSLKLGMFWQGSRTSVEVSARETVSTPAGIFHDCLRVDVRDADTSKSYSVWLANDVGPVKFAKRDADFLAIESVTVLHSFNVK